MASSSDTDNAITANLEDTTTSNHITEDSVSSMPARDITGDSTSGFTDEGTIGSAVTVDIEIITSNNLTIEGNVSSIPTNGLTSDTVSIEDSASSTPDSNPAGDSSISSAASNVLALPEILENILLRLPIVDMLLAQRVSKTFHGAINSSIHIKRALFFKTRPRTQREEELHVAPEVNPLLWKMFPKDVVDPIDLTGNLDSERGPTLENLLQTPNMSIKIPEKDALPIVFNGHCCKTLNRFISEEHWTSKLPDNSFYVHLPNIYQLTTAEPNRLPLSSAQTYSKASWRRMYATDVPTAVHPCLYVEGAGGSSALGHIKEMKSGKMGHIMEHLDVRQSFLAHFPDEIEMLATWQTKQQE